MVLARSNFCASRLASAHEALHAPQALVTGSSITWSHGGARIQIHPRHLEKLLPTYGATQQTFEMFASGAVGFSQNLRAPR